MAEQMTLDVLGSCPEGQCRYGGAGVGPICDTYCGQQHGRIWASIPDTLPWPERNATFEQRQRDELNPVTL